LTMVSIFACFLVGLFLSLTYGKIQEHPSTWCFVSVPSFVFMFLHRKRIDKSN
jgi:hypothetical protein